MLNSDLEPAARVRQDWRRRRRRDRIVSAASWTMTALAVGWLFLCALAGLHPPA